MFKWVYMIAYFILFVYLKYTKKRIKCNKGFLKNAKINPHICKKGNGSGGDSYVLAVYLKASLNSISSLMQNCVYLKRERQILI